MMIPQIIETMPKGVTLHHVKWIDLYEYCDHIHANQELVLQALEDSGTTWGRINTMSLVGLRQLEEILRMHKVDVPVCMCFPQDTMVYIG